MTEEEMKVIAAMVPKTSIFEGTLYVIKQTGQGPLCRGCPLKSAPSKLCSGCGGGESAVPFFDQTEPSTP